jgi:hypothetical protein
MKSIFETDIDREDIYRFTTEKLPQRIYASTPIRGKEHRTYLTPIRKAINESTHIALNNSKYYNYLGIDIDNPEFDLLMLKKINPTIAVKNRDNNKIHLSFKLKQPVYKNGKRETRWFLSIKERLNKFFGGDKAFTNFLTKNPFHKNYITDIQKKSYTLQELEDFLQQNGLFETKVISEKSDVFFSPIKSISSVVTPSLLKKIYIGNRNTSIFNIIRNITYKLRRYNGELRYSDVYNLTSDLNSKLQCTPLPNSEVMSISKSITNFVNFRYEYISDRDNGVMYRLGLLKVEDRKLLKSVERQSLGALYSANKKKKNTIDKIGNFIKNILSYDNLTPDDINPLLLLNKGIGLSRSTLYRYSEYIQDLAIVKYMELHSSDLDLELNSNRDTDTEEYSSSGVVKYIDPIKYELPTIIKERRDYFLNKIEIDLENNRILLLSRLSGLLKGAVEELRSPNLFSRYLFTLGNPILPEYRLYGSNIDTS